MPVLWLFEMRLSGERGDGPGIGRIGAVGGLAAGSLDAGQGARPLQGAC